MTETTYEIIFFENARRPKMRKFRALVSWAANHHTASYHPLRQKEFFGPTEDSARRKARKWIRSQKRYDVGLKNGEIEISREEL